MTCDPLHLKINHATADKPLTMTGVIKKSIMNVLLIPPRKLRRFSEIRNNKAQRKAKKHQQSKEFAEDTFDGETINHRTKAGR